MKFIIGAQSVMKVTSYAEVEVNLPPGDDPAWDIPADCGSGDPWKNYSLPPRMLPNGRALHNII